MKNQKIYLVVVFKDVPNCWEGLGNIETFPCVNENLAKLTLKKEYDKYKKILIENQDSKDLYEKLEENNFCVHDDNTYYSGEIRELEL